MGLFDSTQATNQQYSSQTNPWGPAVAPIQGLLGGINGVSGAPTAQQLGAISAIGGAAGSLPNFGNMATNVAGGLLSGAPNLNQFAGANYNNMASTLAPYTNSNYTNPYTNPVLSSALQYLNQNITNSINGQFAGAGRDLSPANSQALAYGLGSGEAPLLLNQYNTNVGQQQAAANSLFGAGNTTGQTYLGNQQVGLAAAAQQPQLQLAPALAQLQAAQTAYGLPLSNLGAKEGMILPIAGLGGSTTGASSGTSTYTPSWLQDASLFGGAGGVPAAVYGTGNLLKSAGSLFPSGA